MSKIREETDFPILNKLLSFFSEASWLKPKQLNITLGGYVNKILSFWLIKRPIVMLHYLMKKKDFIAHLFFNLELGSCVTDLLVRLCTV